MRSCNVGRNGDETQRDAISRRRRRRAGVDQGCKQIAEVESGNGVKDRTVAAERRMKATGVLGRRKRATGVSHKMQAKMWCWALDGVRRSKMKRACVCW